jgi:signal transduction histidine kinase/CheY-like chemotaxis protein
MTVAIHPDDIEQRRRERAHRLAVRDLPLLRIIGSAFLSGSVYLHNRYVLGESTLTNWLWVTVVLAVYCVVSTVAVRLFIDRARPRDLTVTFLVLDLVVWTSAIYASGAEQSWLFFILLLRVADQTQTTFRRCLAFAFMATASYAGMLGWVALVDQRPLAVMPAIVKLIFIAGASLYIALTARTAEIRRAQLTGAIRMSRDLIRKLEEQSVELRDARTRAEEANEAKSEFLANMSHEMRTPLQGILGMLQLAREGELSPSRVRQLELARRSAESLLVTIEDILDFSRIEARKLDLEPVYFRLRDMLAETMKTLGVPAAERNLSLAYLVEPEVPDALWGDTLRLRQIIVNLVGNAIKFTPAGEIALRVSLADAADTGGGESTVLRFEIRDTGIGIDPQRQRSIFEPFTQADTSFTRRFGGSGLGLAIVTRLVRAMNGDVNVTSRPGEGTIFSFTASFGCDLFESRPPRAAWQSALKGRSVLVTDRGAASADSIAAVLRSRDMNVDVHRDGNLPPVDRYDLVIGDRTMLLSVGRPVVAIVSPLDPVVGPTVTRPVVEKELLEAVGQALGLVEAPREILREKVLPLPAISPRVLLAEDHPVNQEFAAEAMRRLGCIVTVASDGVEALDILRRERFDLVLMDVQMPHVDGLEVTRQYRATESGPRTRIVALTAHTHPDDRRRCHEAGMDQVLTKPVDARQLATVVHALTRRSPEILEAVGGNVHLLERVGAAFAKQNPAALGEIREAIDTRDGEKLYQSAHKLKGAASNFAGDPAVSAAVEMEAAARGGDFTRAGELYEELERALRDLERRIESAVASR